MDLARGDCSNGDELPPSLRAMLRMSNGPEAMTNWTPFVAPSPLLARMQDFLPRMAAANADLPSNGTADTQSCVEIMDKDDASTSASVGGCGRASGLEARPSLHSHSSGHDANIGFSLDEVPNETAGRHSSEDDAVVMDLYVDNTCGELVARDEDARSANPLIVELAGEQANEVSLHAPILSYPEAANTLGNSDTKAK
jgi:hypothetical protein